jgi:elongation factor Ts
MGIDGRGQIIIVGEVMNITADQVKTLREKTGAGIVDCKTALSQSSGDMDKAVDYLRKKGLASAEKKAGRVTAEGTVASYIHAGGKIGVLVEINCETDFVAKTDEFQALVRDVAMHVAAASPQFVRREEVTKDVLDKEREIFRAQAKELKKPDNVIEKIVDGKIEKYYADICLMEQPFVRDPDKSVQEMIKGAVAKLGENITIRRFARYQLGEGIEKKRENLADAVAKELNS